ncbi:MAG: hypothetical protein NTU97_01915 [Candidatus Magasanikbacteria bacterium]|nr:hypothetical protein [Candidatus Magasanikbacteria bacterium]
MGKKIVSFFLISLMFLSIAGCGDDKQICLHPKDKTTGVVKEDCHTFETYGLLNANDNQNPDVKYKVIWGNVFWGVALSGCFLLPTIYFFGFSMFEPVAEKLPGTPGAIN